MRTFLKKASLVTAMAVWVGGGFVSNVEAGPPFKTGDLDPSFGNNGMVPMIDFGAPYYFANDMALQPDGKIVVVGTAEHLISGTSSYVPTESYFTLTRYNTNGSLDSSFGPNGFVITSFSTKHIDRPSAVAIQPDGKILVVGSSHAASPYYSFDEPQLALARYTSAGALDTSFNGKGFVLTTAKKPVIFGKSYCSKYPEYEKSCQEETISLVGTSIALQADGKIIVGGETDNNYQNKSFLARFKPDGSLDKSFGEETGFVSLPYEEGGVRVIALQPDGKILAATTHTLARVGPDGNLDMSFNNFGNLANKTLGIVDLPFGVIGHVVPKSDGNIIVVGCFCFAVLNPNGSLNPMAIGGKGSVCLDNSPDNSLYDQRRILAIQPDAKLIAMKSQLFVEVGIPHVNVYLERFNPDGSEDPSFDSVKVFGYGEKDYLVDTDISGIPHSRAIVLQDDGKIVILTNFSNYHLPEDALLTRHFNTVDCGNGVKEFPEYCDDGETNGQPNNCNESCSGITSSVCGNGILESGEECDHGAANSDTGWFGCRPNCSLVTASSLKPTGRFKPMVPLWLLKSVPQPKPMPK